MSGPVVLIVLDGYGIGEGGPADASHQAHTPFLGGLASEYPHARIDTSGEAVGLPPGQMGNSEVGHMTLGAGRIIDQDLTRISKAFEDGGVDSNPAIQETLAAVEESGGTLHLVGLVSDGGVHSHSEHLYAILESCGRRGIRAAVHALLDGRDTPPRSALGYLRELQPHVDAAGARVATVIGRYYAMDRDDRWDRVGRAYEAMVSRQGHRAESAVAAVEAAYARHETDEFVEPTVVDGGAPIADDDAVFFFNFRADRARELTNLLTDGAPERFAPHLDRSRVPRLCAYLCMTQYAAEYGLPIAFPPGRPRQILGEVVSQQGLRQLRVAETEKYAHVTFFFNGGLEEPFPGEHRVLIPSPREVPTYDHKPEMSAGQVTDALVEQLRGNDYAFVLLNFANPDMVGHTGVLSAAVKAVETIDSCLARIAGVVLEQEGQLLITADHGNCELMVDPDTLEPHTAHTTNPVPLYWVAADNRGQQLRDGGLADVAPTVLSLMRLPVPDQMQGRSLIV